MCVVQSFNISKIITEIETLAHRQTRDRLCNFIQQQSISRLTFLICMKCTKQINRKKFVQITYIVLDISVIINFCVFTLKKGFCNKNK